MFSEDRIVLKSRGKFKYRIAVENAFIYLYSIMCIIVGIYTFLRIGAHLLRSAPPGAAAERPLEIVQPQRKTKTSAPGAC